MKNLSRSVFLVCWTMLGLHLSNDPSRSDNVSLQQEDGNISFKWGFGALTGSGKTWKFVAINRDTVLKTGDQLKMFVELNKKCFVYVIYQSSTGELELLFPSDFKQFTADYGSGKSYYIPKGQSLFTLDTPGGAEKFFLIASVERLKELESRLESYASASQSKKSELAKEVLTEIRDLKKRHKTFATLAERPISIGGNVRGDIGIGSQKRPDVADIAIEISANNFYIKTYTIDH